MISSTLEFYEIYLQLIRMFVKSEISKSLEFLQFRLKGYVFDDFICKMRKGSDVLIKVSK